VIPLKKILTLIPVLLLIACQREKESPHNIHFQHYFTGSLSAGINELAQAVDFPEERFRLQVTPVEHEAFKKAIRLQLDGLQPPSLFSYWAGARTQHLVDYGQLSPVTPIISPQFLEQIFPPTVIQAMSYNGEVYMIPITRHFVGFFYNKKIFDSFGLEPPRTWEELLEVAQTLKDSGITPFSLGAVNKWPAQFWFDYLLLRSAGFEYRQKLLNGQGSFMDDKVLKAFSLWKSLIDQGFFNKDWETKDWDQAAMDILGSQGAMTLMGTWAIGHYTEKGARGAQDYGFFPFPILDENIPMSALGPIDGIVLGKNIIHEEAIKEVLMTIAGEQAQLNFALASGGVSPHLGIDGESLGPIQRDIARIINQSAYWAFNFDLATAPPLAELGLNKLMAFLRSPEDVEIILESWQNSSRANTD